MAFLFLNLCVLFSFLTSLFASIVLTLFSWLQIVFFVVLCCQVFWFRWFAVFLRGLLSSLFFLDVVSVSCRFIFLPATLGFCALYFGQAGVQEQKTHFLITVWLSFCCLFVVFCWLFWSVICLSCLLSSVQFVCLQLGGIVLALIGALFAFPNLIYYNEECGETAQQARDSRASSSIILFTFVLFTHSLSLYCLWCMINHLPLTLSCMFAFCVPFLPVFFFFLSCL